MKIKLCLNCGQRPAVNKFCSTRCSAQYFARRFYRAHPNPIDRHLKVFTKRTGGHITHGLLTDISLIVGVSRERVRQRANFLGFTPVRIFNKTKRPCIYCGELYVPSRSTQLFCTKKCHKAFNFYKYYTLHVCEICKKGFICRKSIGERKFCGQYCLGKNLATKGLRTRKLIAKLMAKKKGGG